MKLQISLEPQFYERGKTDNADETKLYYSYSQLYLQTFLNFIDDIIISKNIEESMINFASLFSYELGLFLKYPLDRYCSISSGLTYLYFYLNGSYILFFP